MLTEKRQEEILRLLTLKGSVTVQELKEYFDASESTIRRDLNTLDEKGALVKVFGGAMLAESNLATKDEQVSQRKGLYQDEKQQIGEYAASLIEPHDFVYLDAGTTTACMIPYITEKTATFVTNAVSHALELAGKGFVRTHAAYIVALRYCRKFEKNDIVLEGDVKVPVSRERRQMAKEQFMISRRR